MPTKEPHPADAGDETTAGAAGEDHVHEGLADDPNIVTGDGSGDPLPPIEEGVETTGFAEVVEDAGPVPPAPGSYEAAFKGVQQDASGHFESSDHVNSHQSGTRV